MTNRTAWLHRDVAKRCDIYCRHGVAETLCRLHNSRIITDMWPSHVMLKWLLVQYLGHDPQVNPTRQAKQSKSCWFTTTPPSASHHYFNPSVADWVSLLVDHLAVYLRSASKGAVFVSNLHQSAAPTGSVPHCGGAEIGLQCLNSWILWAFHIV